MPPNWKTVHGEPFDEEKWKRAKERAEEEGHAEDYEYITGIYKRMARTGEYKPKFSKERKKKKQTVPEWKESKKNWKKTVKKGFTLVVGGDLDEYRCPECNMLLLKGRNLEKSQVEIKCRRCGTLVSTRGL